MFNFENNLTLIVHNNAKTNHSSRFGINFNQAGKFIKNFPSETGSTPVEAMKKLDAAMNNSGKDLVNTASHRRSFNALVKDKEVNTVFAASVEGNFVFGVIYNNCADAIVASRFGGRQLKTIESSSSQYNGTTCNFVLGSSSNENYSKTLKAMEKNPEIASSEKISEKEIKELKAALKAELFDEVMTEVKDKFNTLVDWVRELQEEIKELKAAPVAAEAVIKAEVKAVEVETKSKSKSETKAVEAQVQINNIITPVKQESFKAENKNKDSQVTNAEVLAVIKKTIKAKEALPKVIKLSDYKNLAASITGDDKEKLRKIDEAIDAGQITMDYAA